VTYDSCQVTNDRVKLLLNTKTDRSVFMLQAEQKGASASEYGLVFGIFELASFISSPILGKYVSDTKLQCYFLV
jgi:hypothetical protein